VPKVIRISSLLTCLPLLPRPAPREARETPLGASSIFLSTSREPDGKSASRGDHAAHHQYARHSVTDKISGGIRFPAFPGYRVPSALRTTRCQDQHLPSGRDLDLVVDIPDARGRPGCSLSLVAFRPRTDVTSENYLIPIHFNLDVFPVKFGGAVQGILDLRLDVRWGEHSLEGNQVAYTRYPRQVLHGIFGGRLLKLVIDRSFEQQLGQEVFDEMKAKGEIIESSPLYDELRPIADAITRAAQPRYEHPFKFYLVHETQPNAFSTPGGNVYVVDSLLYFVKNTDELAGTLCHEASHTIHHDTMELMKKREKIAEREVGAAIFLGPSLGIALLGALHSLSYSRDVESRADITGSDVSAAAGYNPWGLVWRFQDFKDAKPEQVPQLLSDHPDDQNRIDALEKHFRQNPSVFGKFDPDPKSAAPLVVPKNAPEVFLQ